MAEKTVSIDSLAMEKKQAYAGKKLRVAIIGCGGIAQTHIGVLRGFPRLGDDAFPGHHLADLLSDLFGGQGHDGLL